MLNSFIANALSVCLLAFVIFSFFLLKDNSPTGMRKLKKEIRYLEQRLADSEWWIEYWSNQWQHVHSEVLLSGNHHECDICYSNHKKKG